MSLLHSVGSQLGRAIETPQELYMSNVISEAERFASQWNVPPEKLCIMLVNFKWHEKLESNTSILVFPTPAKYSSSIDQDLVPSFLDVLAINAKVVLVSLTLFVRNQFEIIRHKILLHISVEFLHRKDQFVSFNTLFWHEDGSRKFVCVNSFDRLVVWRANASMSACSQSETVCSTAASWSQKYNFANAPKLFLGSVMNCNSTSIRARFLLTKTPDSVFQHSMLYRFSVASSYLAVCFSLIGRRDTDLLDLLQPCSVGVWVVSLTTVVVIAKVISLLRLTGFNGIVVNIGASFITVIDIDVSIRKNSQLLAAASALIFTFLVAQIYKNYLLIYFLNPQVFNDCQTMQRCRHLAACYSYSRLIYDLMQACVCDLDYVQQSLIGLPLHRELRSLKFDSGSYDPNKLYLQTFRVAGQAIDWGQLLLNPVSVSSTIDRLLETGVISERLLAPTRIESAAYSKSGAGRVVTTLVAKIPVKKKVFINFRTTIDWFDGDSFHKFLPGFVVCAIASVAVLGCELLAWYVIRKLSQLLCIVWERSRSRVCDAYNGHIKPKIRFVRDFVQIHVFT